MGRVEVVVEVPVRACDAGGWTDTWFAGHGRVCSLAVGPGVRVRARATGAAGALTFDLADYGVRFPVRETPAEHALLRAAVDEAGLPADLDVEVTIASAVPAGCSLGTSAAVVVGVLAAIDALVGDQPRSAPALARAAHRAEAERLGRQSGVQDQVAAAHGGASHMVMRRYPEVDRTPLAMRPATLDALDRQLLHIAYGAPHDSSAVHEQVIASLEADGPGSPRLEELRMLADDAAASLRAGDLHRYGATLTAATDAQRRLHPDLVSPEAEALIELARSHGALGWKVNGAGGSGGSVSVLCADRSSWEQVRDRAITLGQRPLSLTLAPHGARLVEG